MPKGILYVETRPTSPQQTAEFNKWYDEVHLKEVCEIDGIVSARRFAPTGDDGPFVAIYEVDADDLATVVEQLGKKAAGGEYHMTDAIQLDPPPVVRILEHISTYQP